MKKLFIIIAALTLGVGLSACSEDLLNTNPTDQVSGDTQMNTTDGAYMALNGTYRWMWQWGVTTSGNYHQCFGIQSYMLVAELMGEDFVQAASGNGWFWYDYTYDVKDAYTSSSWRPYDAWNYYYTTIAQVNYILDAENNEEKLKGASADRASILGQAYAIRAYSYYYCAATFARSYIDHEDDPCIPIYTTPTSADTEGAPRATNAEVYAQAWNDITRAIEYLTEAEQNGAAQLHSSHIDLYVANGIASRIALAMGKWQEAYDTASAALAKPGKAIATGDLITAGFNNAKAANIMWGAEIIRDQGTTNPQFLAHMDWRFDGYGNKSRKCISSWLYDKIGTNDVRKAWWNEEVLYDGETVGLQQYKFLFQDPSDPYIGADHIFMRIEEMYLNAAEAACRLNKEGEAKTLLNTLVQTRNADYDCSRYTGTALGELTTDLTGSLLEEILIQRRIELWGEGGRIFDIKRCRQGFERLAEWGHPSAGTSEGRGENVDWKDPDSYDWVLTIPQSEIDANDNINKEDQNPIGSHK